MYLPADAQANLTTIYSDITVQLSYDWDSPTRLAIQHAYGDTWRFLLIAGVSICALGLACMLVWKDTNVKEVHQNKGHVV